MVFTPMVVWFSYGHQLCVEHTLAYAVEDSPWLVSQISMLIGPLTFNSKQKFARY